jgi:hypothetical protein
MSHIDTNIGNITLDDLLSSLNESVEQSESTIPPVQLEEPVKQEVIQEVKPEVSLSNLCEILDPAIVVQPQPRRRGRPKGSTNNKQPVKRKQKAKAEQPDYSHVDASIVPDKILDDLKMTIYSYQAQVSGLIVDFLKLYYMLEPTIDETDYILALHCNFAHRINASLDDSMKEKANKIKTNAKKKTRKPVGDGTCFNTCLEVYIKINHPLIRKDKFYKMKCSSTTGQIQIPGGLLDSKEDCRAVVNLFLDHLKKHNICDPFAKIVSEKISMKNYKSKINIQPGLDLCTHKFSRYFYNIEHGDFTDFEGEYIEPPFKIRETKNPDETPRTSFKFQYGPDIKKDSFRVEIFNNEKKIDVGRINFKGTKVHEYAVQAYDYITQVIRVNWPVFIIKLPTVSKRSVEYGSGSDSDTGSDA